MARGIAHQAPVLEVTLGEMQSPYVILHSLTFSPAPAVPLGLLSHKDDADGVQGVNLGLQQLQHKQAVTGHETSISVGSFPFPGPGSYLRADRMPATQRPAGH